MKSGQENIMYAYVHKAVLNPQAFKLLPFLSTRTKETLESSELWLWIYMSGFLFHLFLFFIGNI